MLTQMHAKWTIWKSGCRVKSTNSTSSKMLRIYRLNATLSAPKKESNSSVTIWSRRARVMKSVAYFVMSWQRRFEI